ncbi:MAG: hypothetical protein K9I70_02565 [Chitinophagaceae bacterium]|jgi:hypothetical protein|nr:hypothetical protein [Chitinophagaceae bacterium]
MITHGTISKENQELRDKIMLGFRMAYEKLVRESALHGESLVFGQNGKTIYIPATELLKDIENKKK